MTAPTHTANGGHAPSSAVAPAPSPMYTESTHREKESTMPLADRAAAIAQMPARNTHYLAHTAHRGRQRTTFHCPLCQRYGTGWIDAEREAALGSDAW